MHGFKKIEAPKARLNLSNPLLILVLHLLMLISLCFPLNFFYCFLVLMLLFDCYDLDLIQSILNEMVTTMELMDLHRSTLLDGGVSGDACLTLEEVIKDLKSLDWQDCHVTSLLAYGTGGTAPSGAGDWIISLKRKRARRSGKKAVKGAVGNSVISTNGTTIVAGSTTERSVC